MILAVLFDLQGSVSPQNKGEVDNFTIMLRTFIVVEINKMVKIGIHYRGYHRHKKDIRFMEHPVDLSVSCLGRVTPLGVRKGRCSLKHAVYAPPTDTGAFAGTRYRNAKT